ncbi:UbiH/UbiF/VisC/COQ6 family ubiquinone biosynthesis hydroxylase [Sphingomonas quercus]|uniref:UbiH/UbiF/VisC/COQ6 family ubiquinone biosynthesis hydroxylase n=1 Tax=Sphingomonas quercus TaxID=2842451 RepID=A0ABS6BF81_9SPHN|nr:UbiH/UbiF/VisC/COQ6 family ubiquinone biosynthesis hydroxylase [Sphingomonas quercus]MBU3076951.1 UbiH/UbiF/VisC/COQ6 family ubiquinone biosynthesis hydroxylase [Sphingomonas quercus]
MHDNAQIPAEADVIILGGGLVGLTLAIALDVHGLTNIVVDPADPQAVQAAGFDGRVSAIASAPWRLLSAIGVGAALADKACPIDHIAVSDALAGLLHFDADPTEGPLGHMVENRALRIALHATANAATNVTLLMPSRPVVSARDGSGVRVTLADGRVLRGRLLIGAEGRNSPTRDAAGLNAARWQYDHTALVTVLEHERPHGNVAHEIFYQDGPFALLPMLPGNRSALVWSVHRRDAEGMLGLSERAFLAEADKRMAGIFGTLKLGAPRSSYPLGFHHAARITGERLALVGDAAHGIHPIAGQGVNVGFRDVAALVEVLVEGARLGLDPGDAQLLARYERWRGFDTLAVAMATDGLTRLFGLKGALPRAARRFGLSMVERLPALKERFMAEARGENGAVPTLLRGQFV